MKVKTALGKNLDMGALILKNEKVRAVGNMSVNARGDTIDGHNKVVVPVGDKVANSYAKTVGNRSSHVQEKKVKRPAPTIEPAYTAQPVLTKEDQEMKSTLSEYDEDDLYIEEIKDKKTNDKW